MSKSNSCDCEDKTGNMCNEIPSGVYNASLAFPTISGTKLAI